MDGLNTPGGGNGPSPKRQRTQVVNGQVCPPHVNDSHEDPTENRTKGLANTDAAPETETEGGPQLSAGFDNMTETVKAGMFMIQSRTQAADAKVVELCFLQLFRQRQCCTTLQFRICACHPLCYL